MTGAPRRRASDHVHPEYWTEADQYRFEDRIAKEVQAVRREMREEMTGLREELGKLSYRITLMLGGLVLLAFLLPLIAPFIRDWLNLPTPVDTVQAAIVALR
jgi:hypothetical protein